MAGYNTASGGSSGSLTTEQVQDIVGGLLTDSAVIDVTYDDAGNVETFTIAAGAVTNAMLAGGIALTKLATDFDTQVRTSRLDQMAAPTSAVALNGQRATGAADPSSAQDLATKAYVDAVAQGLSTKASVKYATTTPLAAVIATTQTLTGAAVGALSIDGTAVAVNDRVLVKNQVAAEQNGIYTVTAAGSGIAVFVLTRATDMDAGTEVPGAFTFVESGTVNTGGGFTVVGVGPWTLGTTAINWTQFSGAGEITAGVGLSKTGNQLDIDASETGVISTSGLVIVTHTNIQTALADLDAAADGKLNKTGGTLTGELVVPDLSVTGLTGATAAGRFVGFTNGASPASGTFVVGDIAMDRGLACWWLCTVAGSPGTWVRVGSSGTELGYAEVTASPSALGASLADIAGLTTTVTVGTRPIMVECFFPQATVTLGATLGGIQVQILEDGVSKGYTDGPRFTTTAGSVQYGPVVTRVRLAPSAGSHTYKLQGRYIGGATAGQLLAAATGPGFITVTER